MLDMLTQSQDVGDAQQISEASRKIWKSSLDWKLERLHFVWPGLSHEPSGQQPVPAQRDFLWCRWTLNKLWVESWKFQRRWQQCSALGALWHSETWAYQGKEHLGQAWQHVKVSSPCRFKVLLLPGILLGNLWPGETSYDMRSKFEPWKSTISGDNSLPSCTSCSHHIRPQPRKWKGRWNQNNAHHFRTIGSKMIHISTNSSPMFWRQYLVGKDLTLGLDPLSIEFPPPLLRDQHQNAQNRQFPEPYMRWVIRKNEICEHQFRAEGAKDQNFTKYIKVQHTTNATCFLFIPGLWGGLCGETLIQVV